MREYDDLCTGAEHGRRVMLDDGGKALKDAPEGRVKPLEELPESLRRSGSRKR
jgi:hypothetical protein